MSLPSSTSIKQPQPHVHDVEDVDVITCKEQVNVSPPQPMEIRIKVVCTSLCRSDLSAWESQQVNVSPPQPMEIRIKVVCTSLCRIESVGEGVTECTQGDHVLTVFIGEYGKCRQCASGKTNICHLLGLERRGVMHCDQRTRFSINATGEPVYHYCAVSSFSEYTVVHSGCAVKISSLVPLEEVCLLSCGVAGGRVSSLADIAMRSHDTCIHMMYAYIYSSEGLGAASNIADISNGSSVVIFGLGTVGLSVSTGLPLYRYSRPCKNDSSSNAAYNSNNNGFVCDRFHRTDHWSTPTRSILSSFDHLLNPSAKAFGITEFIKPNDSKEPIQQVIKHMTGGGADYSFECIGDTGMVIGNYCIAGMLRWMGFDSYTWNAKVKPEITAHYGAFLTGRTLKGSLFGGWKPKTDLPSLVEMYTKKEIQVDEYLTHNLPFEDVNKAFNLMREGKCLRCRVGVHPAGDVEAPPTAIPPMPPVVLLHGHSSSSSSTTERESDRENEAASASASGE
ncbi:hypothetical protein DVH24_023405 [Malus domestica]|uniref:Alcohol dehydrogenase-like N-terminal domain-containing protein n=1 Tax=Malus domestica TaxID=3750 RepID=A0A498I6J6_MALDO|nr:hypothetical protein DVH24_023405 [Malus domestica]